jgi:hypothetical protein
MAGADPLALHYIAMALDCERRANHAATDDIARGWRQIGESYQRLAVVATRAPGTFGFPPPPSLPPRADPASRDTAATGR